MKNNKTSIAYDILHRRYIGKDAARQASLEVERVNAEVASTIYELRKKAGLTQKELAQKVGTTQSVISRLEDADYEGHSLSMLNRIAMALNRRLYVQMVEPFEKNGISVHQDLQVSPRRNVILSHHKRPTGLKPGSIAPRSGLYQQIGPRGGRGKEVIAVKGEPLPPTGKKNIHYVLVDPIKSKSGKK
jgi:transcriptional regulator with XRE-family HTH domain